MPLAPWAFLGVSPRTRWRACLFAMCVLLLATAFWTPTPASASSLLVGGSGFVLERPLLLQGVDVGKALSTMEQALSTVHQALQTAQDDIADLKLKNTQLQVELTAATQQITELQRSDVQQANNLTLHAAQLDSLEQFQSRAEASLSALNGTVTAHGTRLASLESNVAGLDTRLGTAESNLTGLDTRMTAADTAATALTDRVNAVETAATALTDRVTAAETAATALTDRVSSAETAAAALADRVSTAEGNLTALTGRVSAAETAASALTTRVGTAESGLTGLSTRVAAAENLNGTATALTTTVLAVRDLTASTPLYTAVNNMRTLAPGTTLTDTLIAVRDLTSGTPLYTTVTGLQSTVSGQGTRLTAAEGGLADLTTRVSAAENLNGTATTLTVTVLALRDLTGGSALVTTLKGLRDNSGSSALVTTLGSLRNKTDSGSALIRSLPCYGETDTNAWGVYKTTSVYVNVSIASCGFSVAPQHVSASLYGNGGHWMTLGASSIYPVSATSFQIYIMPVQTESATISTIVNYPLTPEEVAARNWRISWMAVR